MQYYFSNDGTNQQGPVERDQLKSAGVTARTMVWREGMSAWTPAGQVPELADLFGNEPPPMQPPPPSPGLPPQHLPPHEQRLGGVDELDRYSHCFGSVGTPWTRTSKWRWSPVA